jgi:hypothetical protein
LSIYRGINGVNRELIEIYRGVDGVNREIVEVHRGVGGVNRKVFDKDKSGEIIFLNGQFYKSLVQNPSYSSSYNTYQPYYSADSVIMNLPAGVNKSQSVITLAEGIRWNNYKSIEIQYRGVNGGGSNHFRFYITSVSTNFENRGWYWYPLNPTGEDDISAVFITINSDAPLNHSDLVNWYFSIGNVVDNTATTKPSIFEVKRIIFHKK